MKIKNLNSKQGFTLIELLVVIVIIGILAAIALPQYQKSTEKANVAPILSLLKSLYQAQESFYLTNGVYAQQFSNLDIDFTWKPTSEYWNPSLRVKDSLANEQWIAEIVESGAGLFLSMGRKSGKYAGTGFQIFLNPKDERLVKGIFYCAEDSARFEVKKYCPKIFQATSVYPGQTRLYKMGKF